MLANYYFAFRSRRALKGNVIDICIAHDTHALNAAVAIARPRGARLVYDAVEIPLIRERSGQYQANHLNGLAIKLINECIEPRTIRRADLVISNSPGHARWHREHYRLHREPALVCNARPYQPPSRTMQIRQDAGLAPHERLVLYIGNAQRDYGLEELVRALPMMAPRVHVGFLGFMPDSYAAEITGLVQQMQVGPRFHVLAPVANDAVPCYASGADVGVVTLHRKVLNMELSLPNRFFDCVMARLPIAASELPAVVQYIDHYGIGMTFDEQRPEHMARVIEAMLEDERQAEFRARAERAAVDLCWERGEQTLVSAIEGLASGSRGLRICIVARKNIWRTRRVVRMAESLQRTGHQVTVVCPFPGDAAAAQSGVRYLTADDGRGLARRLLARNG
ncbi:MAG: glycosyltransferase [Gammaproteobacteria bacterium]